MSEAEQGVEETYNIVVVCLGNICRSPMAASVLRERINAAGLADRVEVSSAGTAGWHVGAAADARARKALRRNGYPDDHRAQQFTAAHARTADLVLAMDVNNHEDLLPLTFDSGAALRMFREFDAKLTHLSSPDERLDVPDPYYGPDSGFDDVLAMIESAADGVVAHLRDYLADS